MNTQTIHAWDIISGDAAIYQQNTIETEVFEKSEEH